MRARSVVLIVCVPVMVKSVMRIPAFLLERWSLTHSAGRKEAERKRVMNKAHGVSLMMAPPRVLIHSDSTPLGCVARPRKVTVATSPLRSSVSARQMGSAPFSDFLEDRCGSIVGCLRDGGLMTLHKVH